jgi:hypothetical protein
MAEIPALEIHHLATLTPASITGAKGVGEGGAIGAPAAVLNAVSDALRPFGIGIHEMPATPRRIRELLRDCPSPWPSPRKRGEGDSRENPSPGESEEREGPVAKRWEGEGRP